MMKTSPDPLKPVDPVEQADHGDHEAADVTVEAAGEGAPEAWAAIGDDEGTPESIVVEGDVTPLPDALVVDDKVLTTADEGLTAADEGLPTQAPVMTSCAANEAATIDTTPEPKRRIVPPRKPDRFVVPRTIYDFGWPPKEDFGWPPKEVQTKHAGPKTDASKISRKKTTGKIIKNFAAAAESCPCPCPCPQMHDGTGAGGDVGPGLQPSSSSSFAPSPFSHATSEYLRSTFGGPQSKRIEKLLVKYLCVAP
jgi:hypothetical protein